MSLENQALLVVERQRASKERDRFALGCLPIPALESADAVGARVGTLSQCLFGTAHRQSVLPQKGPEARRARCPPFVFHGCSSSSARYAQLLSVAAQPVVPTRLVQHPSSRWSNGFGTERSPVRVRGSHRY